MILAALREGTYNPGIMNGNTQPRGWHCLTERTRREWIDENGHVNIQFYYRLMAHGVFELLGRIFLGGRRPDPPPMLYTLETRILYRAELMAEEPVEVYIRPISRTDKVLKLLIEIHRAGREPALASQCEWTGAYADWETRRIAPLGELPKAAFDAKAGEEGEKAEAPPAYPPGSLLPEPAPEGWIRSFEGEVARDWIDRMGHMGIEHYQLIFERANRGLLRHFSLERDAAQGTAASTFALGSHERYRRELKLGERFEVRSRMVSLQKKTFTYHHELLRAGGEEGTLCATSEHTSAFVDLERRKVIELPEEFIRRVRERYGTDAGAVPSIKPALPG